MTFLINEEEKKILLSAARESIKSALEGRNPQIIANINDDSALQTPSAAFVTLHKNKALRGCIGSMRAERALAETVQYMAREAAFKDPRFPPIESVEELNECDIEISALSPFVLCKNPQEVQVGVHGLYLIRGGRGGVLLPQVPVEQGWNRSEYLDYICVKAGLPPHSYDAADAQLFTFTAVVFSEK
jgi:AmmeMemoRadiSam system protein A